MMWRSSSCRLNWQTIFFCNHDMRDRIGRFCAIGEMPFKAQKRDFLFVLNVNVK